ncbi:hypothetical protein QWZ10_02660 [Paracoccus cavernae]|uniref:Uncharacterized protein n=1 Tax=Paracoccus cavernae TaxID=1571207 RepID=A0ABT8D572_9RHOB|nr:hypothetical protein [Paracoccus cavernae]
MLKIAFATVIRWGLVASMSSLATLGLVTATAQSGYYCFDARLVADAAALALVGVISGGGAVAAGVGWRWWAGKRR